MASQLMNFNTASKHSSLLFPVLLSFLVIFSHGSITAAVNRTTNIGAIIDIDSGIGKEQKIAMKIAVRNLNNDSVSHRLTIHFINTGKDPLRAASAADELIKKNQVQVIIGMQTWQEAALVADVGRRAQVPVISFAAAAPSTPPLAQLRWPFLIQMATSGLEQIKCTAEIVKSYNWRRVVAIYEDDNLGGDSGMLSVLYEEIRSAGAEIEHVLVLPPFSSLADPNGVVRLEVSKLLRKRSRVFVVLRSSLSLATHLFREAKQIGLMGRDSAWIMTDCLSSLLDSAEPSVISSMQGALGIMTYFPEDTRPFSDFKHQFRNLFRSEYPEEDNLAPGIHALRAYDSIAAVAHAAKKWASNNTNNTSEMLLKYILASSFTGLSGDIRFHGGELSPLSVFRIVNIVGKKYKQLGFWSSKLGFLEGSVIEEGGNKKWTEAYGVDSMKKLSGLVNWPSELNRAPKGWAMPTDAVPMKIGVPGRTSFEKFVKVEWNQNPDDNKYTGFCIDVFLEVLRILEQNYTLPYQFVACNCSYDQLVDHVIDKNFDAVVGDITILANRSRYVEFTQPFAESGLSMLVPVKSEPQRAWIFMKPFNAKMWMVTGAILFYTMFVVWFVEHHQPDSEFGGRRKDQIGTALWFTLSSLFYAHREKVNSNLSKVVVVVWLFLVFVLNSSYTASLSSILTVPRLEPSKTDIEWIRRTNAPVGCDGDSFVNNYLRTVLRLSNVKSIGNQYDYPGEFGSGNITAAFLELPYEKVFLKEYCNEYMPTGPTYRFGGLGFVFQKGSPIARDVSEAILIMSENGILTRLEEHWFGSSHECSDSDASTGTDSLNLESFWGLYLVSATTSTICFLIFLFRLIRLNRSQNNAKKDEITSSEEGVWSRTAGTARYLLNGGAMSLRRARTFVRGPNLNYQWALVSPSDASEHFQASQPPAEIEIPVESTNTL